MNSRTRRSLTVLGLIAAALALSGCIHVSRGCSKPGGYGGGHHGYRSPRCG